MKSPPYLTIGAITFAIAILIALARFPAEPRQTQFEPLQWRQLLRAPGCRFALLAQFCYVGAQVGAWSFFIDFAKETDYKQVPRYDIAGSILAR